MNVKKLFKNGMKGKIKFNEDKDCYILEQKVMDFGIMSEGFWDNWSGEEVIIIIKKVKEQK